MRERAAWRSPDPGLYGQDLDVELLLAVHARLDEARVVDVGAERGGAVLAALLRGGAMAVDAFEPYPPHAAVLCARFGGDPRSGCSRSR